MKLKALLNVHSYFSFGEACSSPTTLVKRAAELGYSHLAITDTLGVYATVELYLAAKEQGIKPLIGASFKLEHEGSAYPIVILCSSKQAYKELNELINLAKESKTQTITLSQLEAHSTDLHLLTAGRKGFLNQLLTKRKVKEARYLLRVLKAAFQERLWVQLFFDYYPWDLRRARSLRDFSKDNGVSCIIAPEVRYATPDLMPLHDSLVCARLGINLATPHEDRPLNDCQALPEIESFPLIFQDALENSNNLAEQLYFDLLPDRLTPPPAIVPDGYDADSYLGYLTRTALLDKYPHDLFAEAKTRLERELYTIKSLGFADFFLVVREVMAFCRSRGILASGRGSAAGSVICYLLDITQADPVSSGLLFERFLHAGKRSMPDIDIDIASSRRTELFAWIEQRFPNSAMVCNRITYYLPSAIQDIGRAIGLPPKARDTLTHALGRDYRHTRPHRASDAQVVFDEILGEAPVKQVLIGLLKMIEKGFVRQVAPHSGGWVLSRYPLSMYSPQERSTGGLRCLQFDKDDVETLGLMKLDLLGLRILGAFEQAREEIIRTESQWIDFNAIPEDENVWQTISAGDTMTVFQLESPAQTRISTRHKPQNKEDLKTQVSIVRPGPIQSGSVDPYIARREGKEDISYPHESLKPTLEKTLGVILYQEQVMQIAHHFAGFSWEDADKFRKKVASFEDEYEISKERKAFITGAQKRHNASPEKAQEVFNLCAAFRGFGFAESHAWAFGLHAYASAWLRQHYPAEYFAGFMTEQPGMYSANTLRQEARRWNVGFARLDINHSSYHYFVEKTPYGKRLRPPLSVVKQVSIGSAKSIVLERLKRGPYKSLKDLFERIALDRDVLEALDRAGAFSKMIDRREGLYHIGVFANTQEKNQASLFGVPAKTPPFPKLSEMEKLEWDFKLKGLSEHTVHPVDLYRNQLLELGATPMEQLRYAQGFIRTAGLVVAKQKPPTAKGFAFWLLEDNSERIQVIIHPDLWQENRQTLRDSKLLITEGHLSREARAWTLKAKGLWGV